MNPIDAPHNNPAAPDSVQKSDNATLNQIQQNAIQNPQNQPVQGGHRHVETHAASPVQQAPAATQGHEKSWKSHFAHMQNPVVTVIKKYVKAEMKRISQEEKKIRNKEKEGKREQTSDQEKSKNKKNKNT